MSSSQTNPEAPAVKSGRNVMAGTIVVGHGVKHLLASGFQKIIMPEMKIGLGLSNTQFGALGSAQALSSWAATMVGGYLGDRFANKAAFFIALSLGITGVSYFIAGFAPNYWLMFFVMLLAGAGPSLFHPPALGELSRGFPEKRGFVVSLHGTGGIAGEILGPVTTAAVLSFLMWRDVLTVSLFPAMVTALLVWGILKLLPRTSHESVSRRGYFKALLGLMKSPVLMVLVLSTVFRAMGEAAVDVFLPAYLRETLAYSSGKVALYLSLAQVMGLVSQPLMGHMADRYGAKKVLMPAMVSSALLMLGLALAEPGWQLLVIIVVAGSFKFTLQHIFVAAAIEAAKGQSQSTVVSLIYGASILGILSPFIAGVVSDSFGIESAFIYAAGMAAVATVLLARFRMPSGPAAAASGKA
ncbi:MAG: MFS transporter [SAR202 cluster bacterium]|nr:MFS transporter [SAR202 cluster bacterium]